MEVSKEQSAAPKKPSNGVFESLSQLLQSCGSIFKNLLELAALEAGLARKSLLVVICALVIFALFISATWLVLMAILAVALVAAGYSWLVALSGIFILHVVVLIALSITIYKHSLSISFSATRRQASELFNKPGVLSDDSN